MNDAAAILATVSDPKRRDAIADRIGSFPPDKALAYVRAAAGTAPAGYAIRSYCQLCQGPESGAGTNCEDQDCILWGYGASDRPRPRKGNGRVSPRRIIPTYCLDCEADDRDRVTACPSQACPLWPYRFGKRPESQARKVGRNFTAVKVNQAGIGMAQKREVGCAMPGGRFPGVSGYSLNSKVRANPHSLTPTPRANGLRAHAVRGDEEA
jgi:hypothetical protein